MSACWVFGTGCEELHQGRHPHQTSGRKDRVAMSRASKQVSKFHVAVVDLCGVLGTVFHWSSCI